MDKNRQKARWLEERGPMSNIREHRESRAFTKHLPGERTISTPDRAPQL